MAGANPQSRRSRLICRTGIAFFAIALSACSLTSPRLIIDAPPPLGELERERQDAIHEALLKLYGRYDNDAIQGVAQRVGEQLAIRNQLEGSALSVTVLDTPQINAFSHGIGYVYVTRGLLTFLESESELAAIIAHELGHLQLQHLAKSVEGSLIAAYSYERDPFELSLLKDDITRGSLVPHLRIFARGFSDDAELAAIRAGAQLLARAGYDPQTILRTLRFLEQVDVALSATKSRQLASHSAYHGLRKFDKKSESRLDAAVMAALAERTEPMSFMPPANLVSQLDQLALGESFWTGREDGGKVYHRSIGLILAAPERWRWQGLTDSVILYPENKEAFVAVVGTEADSQVSVAQFMKSYFKIDNLAEYKQIGLTTGDAVVAQARLDTVYGERDATICAFYIEDYAIVVVAASKSDRFWIDNVTLLQAMLNDIRPMNEADRKVATPNRLKIVSVTKETTLEKLISKAQRKVMSLDELRLINRLGPDGQLEIGQLLKSVD